MKQKLYNKSIDARQNKYVANAESLVKSILLGASASFSIKCPSNEFVLLSFVATWFRKFSSFFLPAHQIKIDCLWNECVHNMLFFWTGSATDWEKGATTCLISFSLLFLHWRFSIFIASIYTNLVDKIKKDLSKFIYNFPSSKQSFSRWKVYGDENLLLLTEKVWFSFRGSKIWHSLSNGF